MTYRTAPVLAALLLGTAGLAFAQGNPPTTASPNPATGAGQQSPIGGPMGTTGTPTAADAAPAGSAMSTPPAAARPMRPARADRN